MNTFKRENFMSVENIHQLLADNVDPNDVKNWFEDNAYEGRAFAKLSESLFNIDEDEYIWVVASCISEELEEDEFLEVIRDERWDIPLPPMMRFLSDTDDFSYIDYVNCTIKLKETGKFEDVIIAVGKDFESMEDEPYDDEDIFFYCDDADDVVRLFNEDNGEEFYIFEYDSVE